MPFPNGPNGPLSQERQKMLDTLNAVPGPKKRPSNAVDDAMDSDAYDDAVDEEAPPVKKPPIKLKKIEWKNGLIPRLARNAPDEANIRLCASGNDAEDIERASLAAATEKADQQKRLMQKVPKEHRPFVVFAMETMNSNTILKVLLENSKEAFETILKDPTDDEALSVIFGLMAAWAKSLMESDERMKKPMKIIEISWLSDDPILASKSNDERLKVATAVVAHAEKLEAGGETNLTADDQKYLTSYVAKEMKSAPKGKAPAPKGGAKEAPAGGRAHPQGAGRGGRGGAQGPSGGRAQGACFSCGIAGHRAVDCRNPQPRAIAPPYQNNNGQTVWPQVNRGFHGHAGVGAMPAGMPPQPPR